MDISLITKSKPLISGDTIVVYRLSPNELVKEELFRYTVPFNIEGREMEIKSPHITLNLYENKLEK